MSLHVRTTAGCAVVVLPEEVDIANIEDLRAEARTQLWEPLPQLREIVFDLTGTRFFGTEAAHLIRETRRRGRDHDVVVFVVCLSSLHRHVLDCMGLGPDTLPLDRRWGSGPARVWLPRQRGPGS